MQKKKICLSRDNVGETRVELDVDNVTVAVYSFVRYLNLSYSLRNFIWLSFSFFVASASEQIQQQQQQHLDPSFFHLLLCVCVFFVPGAWHGCGTNKHFICLSIFETCPFATCRHCLIACHRPFTKCSSESQMHAHQRTALEQLRLTFFLYSS